MINWSDEFLIGHPKIDSQHKALLELFGDFERARLSDENIGGLQGILKEIVFFAKFHFLCEENIMTRIGYPDLEAHREIHFGLMDILNNKMEALRLGLIDSLEVQNCLLDWFINHTSTEDGKIVAFLKAQASI